MPLVDQGKESSSVAGQGEQLETNEVVVDHTSPSHDGSISHQAQASSTVDHDQV